MAGEQQKVISYISDIKPFLRDLSKLENANAATARRIATDFNKQMQKIGSPLSKVSTKETRQLSGDFSKLANTTSTVTEKIDNMDGTFSKFTETTKVNAKGVATTTRAYGDLNNSTVSLAENVSRLAKRAALTIPLWLVLRGSVMGFISTIKNGVKDINKFDASLQKLRRNMQGTPQEIASGFESAKQAITDFSIETGKSTEEITDAIQRFATVGFDIETAMKAGFDATKLAILEFGNGKETADAFAKSMRVMTEDMTDVAQVSSSITKAMAKTDQLWKTNAFEIDEFTSNLDKFAGTAKIANLSIDETLSLLATLSTGGLGNRAGRLLRSTLLKSLADVENITQKLNLDFDPNKQPTIEFVLELVKALRGMKTVENVPVELADTLGELFTVRGTEVLGALTALEKTLKSNLAVASDVATFNKEAEEQLKTVNRLAERYTNLNREIGKAFVTGIVGGEDYRNTLEKITKIQEQFLNQAEFVGGTLKDAFLFAGIGALVGFRKEYIKLLALMRKPIVLTIAIPLGLGAIKQNMERLVKDAQKQTDDFNVIGEDIAKRINEGLAGKLSADALKSLVSDLEVIGKSNLGLDKVNFSVLTEELYKILEATKEIEKASTKITEQSKKDEISTKRRSELAGILLDNELEILKARGASEAQILRAESAIRKQFSLEKSTLEEVKDRLKTEQAILEEKRLQNKLSSTSVKLFQIAKEEGVQTAKAISRVLSGDTDFATFVRKGGKELEVFKRDFADIFEQQQAQAFFKGLKVPELEGLRGGLGIDIEERPESKTIGALGAELAKLEALFKQIEFAKAKEPTDNNTKALIDNTASLDELLTIYKQGGVLGGKSASDLVDLNAARQQNINNVANRVSPDRRIIDLNVNVGGRDISFSGTPQAFETMISQVSAEVQKELRKAFTNVKDKPQSFEAQSVTQRISQF
jgi:TP901 family phage tail tape measure protein